MDLSDRIFFHGSSSEVVTPRFGLGDRRHDYGCGWRADASYFYIVTEFVHDEVDIDILEELLMIGNLGVQFCLKSERAFLAVEKIPGYPLPVDFATYNSKYDLRDRLARKRMDELISGPRNAAVKVMSTLV